ncbi:MAG: hypothetical protein KC413_06295, partial [Anaerolineales bacterium]|nr:hypothetical protein [Anaerolineales bacterium]
VCAMTNEISVAAGTMVYYCYEVTNTGNITLTLHDLTDSELGNLATALPYSLAPGMSTNVIISATIDATTVNTATWTAYNPGPSNVATATATATVHVEGFSLFLPVIVKP